MLCPRALLKRSSAIVTHPVSVRAISRYFMNDSFPSNLYYITTCCQEDKVALTVQLDIQGLLDAAQELDHGRVVKIANEAVRDLSAMAYGHLQELVQSELHSTREKYLNALSLRPEQVDGVWVINLDQSARFIEDGLEPHDQLPDLLKSPKAKVSKSGQRYVVVPFNHSERPSNQTPYAQDLTKAIKKFMKTQKIPFKGLEKDGGGNFKQGLLHS